VLDEALRQTAAWRAAGLPVVPVAINLSVSQFRHPRLQEDVAEALRRHDLPAHLLELELTESVAMEDSDFTIARIASLKQLGVTLSIDDFGTGYSSLSYLKRFTVDKLKIDQSFVRGLAQSPQDEAIVATVINLARSLGLHTVAEGVETAEQLDFLRRHGCDEIQGYHFHRPAPAEVAGCWLPPATLPLRPSEAAVRRRTCHRPVRPDRKHRNGQKPTGCMHDTTDRSLDPHCPHGRPGPGRRPRGLRRQPRTRRP
jgi:EAL domain-containing protein (putative c-di-GMP-specific phosphodiesterase class I)